MIVEFIGGPLDGELREVPDDSGIIEIAAEPPCISAAQLGDAPGVLRIIGEYRRRLFEDGVETRWCWHPER